jgi:urea carboxylase
MARLEIKSEVNGIVWKVEAAPGSAVSEGDVLVIIESMKMEIAVHAPASGKVGEILVAEEEPVSQGQTVAVVEV